VNQGKPLPPSTATGAAESIKTILVYIGSNPDDAIGENILKLPFLRALRSAFPDARLTWIAGIGACQFQGILSQIVDGMIDECLTDFRIDDSARELFLRWRPLPRRKFDLIIDAQRNAVRTLVLRRIPHRLFISGCWRYFFSDVKPPEELVHPRLLTDRLLGLAAAATGEVDRPPHIWPLAPKWLDTAAHLLPKGPTYVGLAPGAGKQGTGKCWPLDRFLALAGEQRERGRQPVFFLGPEEKSWLERVRRDAPYALLPEWTDESERGGLNGPPLAMALAHRLDVAVANCSGIGHILAAGGTRMVSLYGPTQPDKYAPYTPTLIALRAQDFGAPGNIENIPTEAVSAAIDRQLEQASIETA
jgi:ADP-heptose:LPS heptosyltransferase